MKNETLSLLNRVDARLAACAAAAGASLAVSSSAQAAIIYSGPVSISIPTTTAGVYLNVVTGANSSLPSSAPGWDVNPWSSTNLSFFSPSSPSGGAYVGAVASITSLNLGDLISAANSFTNVANSALSAPIFNSSNNFVGFRFINEAAGSQLQFGWLQISLGATLTDPARAIVGYAYENTGAGIGAGNTGANSVPDEANTFALLALTALGALGVRAWRERQTAA
jgi:hypothetical protein